jgi:hypothetical protein
MDSRRLKASQQDRQLVSVSEIEQSAVCRSWTHVLEICSAPDTKRVGDCPQGAGRTAPTGPSRHEGDRFYVVMPVMKPALSEARNETRFAISSGRPSCAVRLCLLRVARMSVGTDSRAPSVMMTPGDTPTARMPGVRTAWRCFG